MTDRGLTIPPMPARAANWLGIYLSHHPMPSFRLVAIAVTVKSRRRRDPWRRWFDSDAAAMAFALDYAERFKLPLFDLRDEGAGE